MIKNKKRIILVVGPYRSGTSVLTKGLSALGVLLTAPLFNFPAHNPKGDWEDPQFQNFNNEILNKLSSLAKRSRSILSITEEEINFLCKQGFVEQAAQLLSEKFSDSQPLGMKYPRVSILLPFWKQVFKKLDLHVSFVIALRNPESVVASITAFTQEPPEKSFWIWISFLLSCLEHSEGYPRILVDYDQLIKDPAVQIKRIAKALELDVNHNLLQDYSDHFIDPTLCHFKLDCTIRSGENNIAREEDDLLRNDFCGKFSMEMYQQLLAVAKDKMPFEGLKKFLKKWREQLLSVRSLLCLAEKNEFGYQAFEQQAIEELRNIKNALNASITEKMAFATNVHQAILQRDDQLASLMQERVNQEAVILQLMERLKS
ncbi:MAG: sulfotransferase [Verrucomicrobiae bacterium]|nr:sulfotransferase [Verrucomicrobiae bacterium]